jgi:hypothetical protein
VGVEKGGLVATGGFDGVGVVWLIGGRRRSIVCRAWRYLNEYR